MADRMQRTRAFDSVRPIIAPLMQTFVVLALCGALFGVIEVYKHGLRDPRYLDGWLLASGMLLQLGFHIAIKTTGLSPKSAKRWRAFHIALGYLLIGIFASHSDFSLPDTAFEWWLWLTFVAVSISGIFGIYLSWSSNNKRGLDGRLSPERIATRRAEIAGEVETIVAETDTTAPLLPLPLQPHDAWIADLYAKSLQPFFAQSRNLSAHLLGSQNHIKPLTDEIDNLARYSDKASQEKLANIKDLVFEKDRLDFASVHGALMRGWLFVHVPATYAIVVMSILHVIVVYAFSSGDW